MAQPSAPHPHIPEPSHGNLWLSVLGVLGCFLIFLIVLLVKYVPARATAPTVDLTAVDEQERWKYDAQQRRQRLLDLQASASQAATTYTWIEPNKVVRLPIDRAMQLVVEEQGTKR